MVRITNYSWKVRNFANLSRRDGCGTPWIDGVAVTPYGTVNVYGGKNVTVLRFVWNGRMHRRQIDQGFTERGLIRKAYAYAREIVEASQ